MRKIDALFVSLAFLGCLFAIEFSETILELERLLVVCRAFPSAHIRFQAAALLTHLQIWLLWPIVLRQVQHVAFILINLLIRALFTSCFDKCDKFSPAVLRILDIFIKHGTSMGNCRTRCQRRSRLMVLIFVNHRQFLVLLLSHADIATLLLLNLLSHLMHIFELLIRLRVLHLRKFRSFLAVHLLHALLIWRNGNCNGTVLTTSG